jgi:heat shock protein HspQ
MISFYKPGAGDGPPTLFSPGDLVRHKRYHYRGVVVDFNLVCHADEHWYQSNQTRPDRDQPWYHVLVDGNSATTYAAQSSLDPDNSGDPVDHPLIGVFFTGFVDGAHLRNDTPWPV